MKHSFLVRKSNIIPHLDIEKDIKAHKDGIFTMTLRVNQGNIVDYVNYINTKPGEYEAIFGSIITECQIA